MPSTAYHSVLLEVAANYFLAVFWIVGVLPAGLPFLQETGSVDIASGFLYRDSIFKKLLTWAGYFQSLTNSIIGLLKTIVAAGLC